MTTLEQVQLKIAKEKGFKSYNDMAFILNGSDAFDSAWKDISYCYALIKVEEELNEVWKALDKEEMKSSQNYILVRINKLKNKY